MGRTKGGYFGYVFLMCMWLVPMLTVVGRSIQNDVKSDLVFNNENGSQNEFSNFLNEKEELKSRVKRQGGQEPKEPKTKLNMTIVMLGMSFEYDSDKKRVEYDESEVYIVEALDVKMWVYGKLLEGTFIMYTKSQYSCTQAEDKGSSPFPMTMMGKSEDVENSTGQTIKVYTAGYAIYEMPSVREYQEIYFCLRHKDVSKGEWIPQGADNWVHVKLHSKLLPTWLHVLFIITLLLLSGLFSGLNLGLMSLNKTDLKIITNTGTPAEREFAAKIAPVRNHGNFLLCCLLFSNVLVNASLTILVDELTSGIIAITLSTLAIVIFGEIIPQAICSRHGLAVGAKTIYITKFFMAITFPLAYPLSKVLDKCLGEEIGSVYTRERLKELLRVTKDHHGLENEEVGIISGALDMKTKTVRDVMTSLDAVFMVSIDSNLDFDTLAEIDFQGYSRIPVYERERGNVVAVLNVKQLTLLDGSDSIPIRTVVEYYKNSLFYVFENTRLDYMFRAFREGNRGHMAFVQKVNDEGPGDPYYETVGVVTMEDVLEELLQAEIMDETDVGKFQARLAHKERPREVPFTSHRKYKQTVEVQPQLALAAVQYLATNVDAFDREFVSENIVQRLLTTSVFTDKPLKSRAHETSRDKYLYKVGEPADSFIMILEGKVEVVVGSEGLTFDAGPFNHFGANFLLSEFKNDNFRVSDPTIINPAPDPSKKKIHTFIPDYSVRVISEVFFIRLKYSGYLAARQATDMERNYKDPARSLENKDWEDEIEKVLNAADEGMPAHKRVHMAPDTVSPTTPVNGPQTTLKQLLKSGDSTAARPGTLPTAPPPPSSGETTNRRRKSEPGDKSETKHLL